MDTDKSKFKPWMSAWFFGLGYFYCLPLSLYSIGDGTDEAWRNAICYAFVHHFQFGKQIIFTSGPLGFVYAQTYYPGTLLLNFLIRLLIQTGLTWNFLSLVKRMQLRPVVTVLVGSLFFAMIPSPADIYYFWLIFIVSVNQLLKTSPPEKGRDFTGALSLALTGLLKFSFLSLAVLSLGLTAVKKIKEKTIPVFELLTGFLYLAIWCACSQHIENTFAYLYASYDLGKYYVSAMSLPGPMSEPIGVLFGTLIVTFFARKITKSNWFALLSLIVCYFLIKASLVRQDHASFAGAFFVVSAMLALLYVKRSQFIAICAFVGLIFASESIGVHPLHFSNEHVHNTAEQIDHAIHFASIYKKWQDDFLAKQIEFKNKYPLPENLRVDAVSLRQSNVIAYGDIYTPRPVIQSYAAYSPYLIQKNKEFFFDSPNPPTLLYYSEPVDERLASQDEPYLFAEVGNKVELMKSLSGTPASLLTLHPERKPRSFVPFFTQDLKEREKLNLGIYPCQSPIWAQIKTHKNLFQRLEELIYKGPIHYVDLNFKRGQFLEKRFIPGIGEFGFLLDPYTESVTNVDMKHFLHSEQNCQTTLDSISFHSAHTSLGIESTYTVTLFHIEPGADEKPEL